MQKKPFKQVGPKIKSPALLTPVDDSGHCYMRSFEAEQHSDLSWLEVTGYRNRDRTTGVPTIRVASVTFSDKRQPVSLMYRKGVWMRKKGARRRHVRVGNTNNLVRILFFVKDPTGECEASFAISDCKGISRRRPVWEQYSVPAVVPILKLPDPETETPLFLTPIFRMYRVPSFDTYNSLLAKNKKWQSLSNAEKWVHISKSATSLYKSYLGDFDKFKDHHHKMELIRASITESRKSEDAARYIRGADLTAPK